MRLLSIQFKSLAAVIFIAAIIILCETLTFTDLVLTKPQKITACILLIAACLWITEVIPLFVVSFVILALEIVWLLPEVLLLDSSLTSQVFFSPFFSNIILLFLGGFVLSSLMQKFGLDHKFAYLILHRTQGNAKTTLFGIIIACTFLSMWMSNTATTAMMLATIYPLLNNMPKGHNFRLGLVLSVPFACNIGGIGTPIGTPPNAIALSYLAEKGVALNFLQWIAITFPLLILFIFILWRVLLFLYPPKDLVLEVNKPEQQKNTAQHWAVIAIFLITVCGWFFGSLINLSTGTVALFPIIASFWMGLLDTSDFRKLPWDILYIIAGGLALGVAMKLSGLDRVLITLLPLDLAPAWLYFVIALFVGLMSTFMSNTATAGLVIPLITSLQVEQHYMLTIVLVVTLMCSMAMALPVTTPPNAIAFSSNIIRSKDMIRAGGLMSLIGLIVIATLGTWYWRSIVLLVAP